MSAATAVDTLDLASYGDTLTILQKADGGKVYLLGTCHVSSASASQAAKLVRSVRPSAVVLELCEGRRAMLNAKELAPVAASQADVVPHQTLASVAGGVGGVLTDWTSLIRMQYSALESGLSAPRAGGEFRAAADEATILGAQVVLADRDVDVTTLRLKRLIPLYELAMAMLIEDSAWAESQALERHAAAAELRRTSEELDDALRAPMADAARESRLLELSASLRVQADAATDAAIPSFADAVLNGLLRRFWCKEVIGAEEKQRLRMALDDFNRIDPLNGASLPPTMRRILVDERDLVLCDALQRQPGVAVVGVVGKAHAVGIAKLWGQDLSERLPAAIETPNPQLAPVAAVAMLGIGVPYAAYRSRAVRLGLGAATLGAVGGAAWLVAALRDRIQFFKETQGRE